MTSVNFVQTFLIIHHCPLLGTGHISSEQYNNRCEQVQIGKKEITN